MATTNDRYGLIILGNSGVGKSFLANILLNDEVFKHESTATAVTTETEVHEMTIDKITYAVFNIPGLIEAEQSKVDKNKREIDIAFQRCTNAIIIYVFGNQNGRIRREDVIAFNALNDAYPFEDKSLMLVVNCIPPPARRDKDYEGMTITCLKKILNLKKWQSTCFLEDIGTTDVEVEKKKLRQKFLPPILACMPKIHVKKHDIRLEVDKINDLMKEYDDLLKNFNQTRAQSEEKIRAAQEEHNKNVAHLYARFHQQGTYSTILKFIF